MIRKRFVLLAMVGCLAVPSALLAWPIPDTGQTTCYDNNGDPINPCPQPGEDFYGQDGNYLINPPSYTKLDENGDDLPDTETQWAMVRDNVTGLIWEVKTDDGSIRDKDNQYTWYCPDCPNNGGNAGEQGDGTDTQDFINALNALNAGSGFGGFTDWRLPTREELRSIADYSGNDPAIDTGYFPNTLSADYWSSSTVADYNDSAWGIRFSHGGDRYDSKTGTLYVRAVRGGQGAASDHWVIGSGDTVTDTRSGLMWRRTTDTTTRTWTQALSHCESMTTAGYDDWRLPTVKELASITALDRSNPAIDTNYFSDTVSSYYWSSSTYANGPGDAWNITFDDGWDRFSPKSDSLYVRAVRGGQVRLLGHLFITNPTQASKWSPGCPMGITWDTQSIPGNVNILISTDGGSTFDPILSNIPNDGNHPWTVPNSPSANCVLKIVPLDQPDKETSVGLFSIVDTGTAGLPQISSITPGGPNPTNSSVVTFTATFSEAVFELTQNHFTLATTGSVTGASIIKFSGSGATYTLQVEGISGDGTVSLNFIADCLVKDNDALPVTNDLSSAAVTIDQTPPSVQSIALAGTSPTAATEVVFNVAFSETVQNVDATDFQVTETDSLSGSSVTGVTQSGNQWDVTVSGYSGLGNLGLVVVDDDTILDLAGNPLGGSGIGNGDFVDGPSYQIIPPTYTLNIDLQPAGSGLVTGQITNSTVVDPDTGELLSSGAAPEFTCPDSCSIFVTGGSSVALSATSASGFVFSQWTGVDDFNGTSASLTVVSGQGVGATFLGDRDGDGTPDGSDGCPDDQLKIVPGDCGCNQPETDTDGDGTPDCLDGCEGDALKTSPGDCGCNQPETDTDGDGTPDCIDGCEGDSLKTAPGDCGCGEPETDTDGDGTPDCIDGCADDALKTAPGDCGCNQPETDTDGDGTPDCVDGCADDGSKTAPGDCGCNEPETDTDGDGTPDCVDECPGDADKTEPGACGCGLSDADRNNDGVPDCLDNCPGDPLKTDPGVCGCGNPDVDSDEDGALDCEDECPEDPNKTEPGLCGCGFSDADENEDGVPDCQDDCPDDPAKTEPGVCGCGNPDEDTDEDGALDCEDDCPEDPEKTEPGICGCGFSDADKNGDGLPDCKDECPEDPEKTEPGVCGCGIPDADSDEDGALDCQEACPEDPEKIEPGECGCGVPETGDRDEDGTPDCMDECPDDPAKTIPGECGCGVSEADDDGDETPNCLDECPGDPEKTEPGACGCGVPETGDRDGDGISDCNDLCPDDGAKTEPGACGCGFSDADSDNDGIADCLDENDDPGLVSLEALAPEDGAFLDSEDATLEGLVSLGGFSGQAVETYWWVRPIDKPDGFRNLRRIAYGGIVKHRLRDLVPGLRYIWRLGFRHPQTGQMLWTEFRTFTMGTLAEMEGPVIEPGTVPADFQMGSFCAWPSDSDIVSLLGDRIGPYDPLYYRIGAWDPEAGAYVEYSEKLELIPGRSIWFLARDGLSHRFWGVPVSTTADLQVELHFSEGTQTGWNQIGCPNGVDYRWADVELIAFAPMDDPAEFERTFGPVPLSELPADNPYIRRELWRYEDGSYIDMLPGEEAAVLLEGEGYWVAAKRDHVALVFPASAQDDLDAEQTLMVRSLRKARRFAEAHIGPRNAIAQSAETPPMPMEGLAGETVEDRAGGYSSGGGACFVESAAR